MIQRPRVFVTGARRGIGRGIAYEFADRGYDVAINDAVEDEAVAVTLDGLRQKGAKAVFVKGSVAEIGHLPGMVNEVHAALGGIDVLVNNAGITSRVRGDMLELSPQSFDDVMGVNLRGTFFLTQAVARKMLDTPAGDHPRSIISISSSNAKLVGPDRADYCMSKTAVSMMTKLFAVRLGEAGIGVFEIRPGIIRTDMTAAAKEKYDRAIAGGLTPVRRWGEPSDIGRVAVALASGDFHFSTGDAFNVDGGLHIHHL